MWKIEKIIRKGDYNYCVVKGHPNASRHNYVLHHRVVMENHLGRVLDSSEVVHHRDGNKLNNDIGNLEVLDARHHSKLHGLSVGRKIALMKCPQCGKEFEREYNQTFHAKGGKFTACSKSCSGKFSKSVQLHGLTAEMKSAISGNTLSVYKVYTQDNPEGTHDNGTP